jgi:hypothetical protein
MSDNKLYVVTWSLVAAVLATLILAITYDSVTETEAIKEMVVQGIPAIEAKCAYAYTESAAMCTAVVMNK